MKEEYTFDDENKESEEVQEPVMAYKKTVYPCVFTDEEKLKRIEQAIKDEEAGVYFTHEEILNKYKSKL